MTNHFETIRDLQNDSALMDALAAAETPEAVQAAFAQKGIEVSLEDAGDALARVEAGDELTDEELTEVAGGIAWELVTLGALLFFLLGVAGGAKCKKKKK